MSMELQTGQSLSYRVAAAPAAPRRLLILCHGVGGSETNLATLAARLPADTAVVLVRAPLTLGPDAFFLMIWAERTRMLPFPKETPQAVVEQLAVRTREVLAFTRADRHNERDHLRVDLSPQAQWRYAQFYRGELNDELGDGVLELSNRVLAFLRERGQVTRSQINTECFRGKVSKSRIDACLGQLLAATPPRITVQWSERADGAPGAPLRVYRLAAV